MKLSDIDLRLLRVFQAVATVGGFAKAQGTLGISQPAISAQIAKLEDRLNLRLCERGPKGFALTSEGEKVLTETTMLLGQIDAASVRLNAIGTPEAQRLRIGVVDSMVTDPNNPLIAILRDAHETQSKVKISIGILDFLACIEELRANRLDIALVGIAGNERIPTGADTIPLYQELSNLYCSPSHPCAAVSNAQALSAALAEAQISAHSFVFNPIDTDLDPMLLGEAEGVAQDTIELTAYHALSGSHVGLLPDHYADQWVQSGELVSLEDLHPPIVSEFHAVRVQPKGANAALDALWQSLKSTTTAG